MAVPQTPYVERRVPALPHKRYVIEAQRNSLADQGGDATWFVPCSDADAEIFAVLEHDDDFPGDWDVIADWDTREQAERYVDGLR